MELLHVCLFSFCVWLAAGCPTKDRGAIQGEYLLLLENHNLGPEDFNQFHVIATYTINDVVVLHVSANNDIQDRLHLDNRIKVVEPNKEIHTMACYQQASGEALWGLTRTSSREMPDYTVGTYQFDDASDGHDVNVYVVDTGIYVEHNDFEERAEHGFTAPGITEGDEDLNGHGTHVTGIIGGREHGIAKKANLVAVKVLGEYGSGMVSDLLAGMEFITQQHSVGNNSKSVMNLSLGMSGSSILDEAVEAIIRAGVSAAVVSGNSNVDACTFSPGRVRTAMTASAIDITDSMLASSNYGTCIDIFAPGSNIKSTYIGSPNATAVLSGSSMAGPHAAGWMARYISSMDSAPTPADVKAALEDISTKDVINIPPGKDETPNRLLYASCQWIPE